MSVLIKGMEMPKYCYTCPAYDYIKSFCCVLRTKVINLNDNRYKDCPLVEVPTPHGDLIDRDDVIDEINRITFSNPYDYNTAYDIVKEADTIIEAEVSEL